MLLCHVPSHTTRGPETITESLTTFPNPAITYSPLSVHLEPLSVHVDSAQSYVRIDDNLLWVQATPPDTTHEFIASDLNIV